MLNIKNTVLVIIDVQGKLANLMYAKQELFENLQKIIKGIQVLNIPVLWLEQYPKGMGPTIPEITDLLTDTEPIPKIEFSACKNERFNRALKDAGRKQVLLVGIEAHVCVYQTALDLIDSGYEVHVLIDCVSSRTQENKELALRKMRDCGIKQTSTEMALFELLKVAGTDQFKKIQKIII